MRTQEILVLVTVLAGFVLPVSVQADAENLVLWNTLGSDEEVLSSAYGPNLVFYTGGGWPEVQGDSTYVPGVFGNAVTLAGGPYTNMSRIHNIVLDNLETHIDPERGTIEAWYKQTTNPVAYSHGVYRVFGGSYGLGSGMSFQSSSGDGGRFYFGLGFGGTSVSVYSLVDGIQGHDISLYNETWIHLAGVWDRNGINGTADTMRLYLDGVAVASTTDNSWGTAVGSRVDICGGNDHNILDKFYVDNLKVWSYAKTDFSDRFIESPFGYPVCDADGPYSAECQGATTALQLDGSGSYDPDPDDTLTYAWSSSDCPAATFDDNTSVSPILTLASGGSCVINCTVTLTVTDDDGASASCGSTVTVVDTTPPEVIAPPNVTVTCPEPTDPNATGWASATDICGNDPVVVIQSEMSTPPGFLANPVMDEISRSWIAIDSCGNQSPCVEQVITVMKVVLDLDIKPGSCPNSFNRDGHGVLPVALLGTADFDVTTVDVASVRLSRVDYIGGSAIPHEGPPGPHSVYEDVGTPFPGEPCACHELEGDGFTDLSMKFKTDYLVTKLRLNELDPGALVLLAVTGQLDNGCQFIAWDCVRLVPPGTPPGQLQVVSNAPSTWINITPLDETLDGGGFADFERTYPTGSVVTLTASETYGSYRFIGWEFNGELQVPHDLMIQVTVSEDTDLLEAIYRRNDSLLEVTGPLELSPR